MLKEKKLPINIQKEYNFILGYAFPLCILLKDDIYKNWYYENYINHYVIHTKSNGAPFVGILDNIEYGDRDMLSSQIFDYYYCSLDYARKIDNILTELISKINKEYYCIIFLDEFYVSNRISTNKYHHVHEFLIYGYEETCFMAAAFNIDSTFDTFTISYDEIKNGFSSALTYYSNRTDCEWIGDKMILYLKTFDRKIPYPFSLQRFYSKLKKYASGKINSNEIYFKWSEELDRMEIVTSGINTSYGLRVVIEHLFNYLDKDEMKDMFDIKLYEYYNAVHLFRDHRYGIYKRLLYVIENFDCSSELRETINKYEEVTKLSETIRLLYLKIAVQNTKMKPEQLKSKSIKINNLLKNLLEIEADIFNTIIAQMDLCFDFSNETWMGYDC